MDHARDTGARARNEATFVKSRADAPAGFFDAEAAGLRWLAEAMRCGGARVVEVREVRADSLVLARVDEASPAPEDAAAFGRALARTHAAGAAAYGTLAPSAPAYFFGPLDAPMRLPTETHADFGTFYASARLRPVAQNVALDADDAELLDRLCVALESGTCAHLAPPSPARVHGDLWSGNVMWSPEGAVLVDPAACGHHPLADLAMLTMFGAPHLDAILDAYADAAGLAPGWRAELPLHQLFGYLVHLRLFGAGYLGPTRRALRDAAALAGL